MSRRAAVLAFVAGALAAGALTILVLDVGRSEPERIVMPVAEPAAESIAERWPGARLTTAAAATGSGQSMRRRPLLGAESHPAEALADVGPELSPEWRLALAAPDAYAERKPARTGAQRVAQREPALVPEGAPSAPSAPSAPVTLASADPGMLPHGIAVRIYRSQPDIGSMLAQCETRGFFARPICREEVCKPYLGTVPECPLPEPVILH